MSGENRAMKAVSILFLCHENRSRSTMAEGVFAHQVSLNPDLRRFVRFIDSAGTDVTFPGTPPASTTIHVLSLHNITYRTSKRSRSLCHEDFTRFTHVLATDLQNFRAAIAMSLEAAVKLGVDPRELASVSLFGDFAVGFVRKLEPKFRREGREWRMEEMFDTPTYPHVKDKQAVFELNYEHCIEASKGLIEGELIPRMMGDQCMNGGPAMSGPAWGKDRKFWEPAVLGQGPMRAIEEVEKLEEQRKEVEKAQEGSWRPKIILNTVFV